MTDLGLLSRDSVARRTNREAFLLLGGTAALLLQIGHPLVGAGVAAHSDYQRDPFGRLLRTLNTTLGIVFGTTAQARAPVSGASIGGTHPCAARPPRGARTTPTILRSWCGCR
jgi:uncharacterized protein (DUF2236 family)